MPERRHTLKTNGEYRLGITFKTCQEASWMSVCDQYELKKINAGPINLQGGPGGKNDLLGPY